MTAWKTRQGSEYREGEHTQNTDSVFSALTFAEGRGMMLKSIPKKRGRTLIQKNNMTPPPPPTGGCMLSGTGKSCPAQPVSGERFFVGNRISS